MNLVYTNFYGFVLDMLVLLGKLGSSGQSAQIPLESGVIIIPPQPPLFCDHVLPDFVLCDSFHCRDPVSPWLDYGVVVPMGVVGVLQT